jgi:hypothetical protein
MSGEAKSKSGLGDMQYVLDLDGSAPSHCTNRGTFCDGGAHWGELCELCSGMWRCQSVSGAVLMAGSSRNWTHFFLPRALPLSGHSCAEGSGSCVGTVQSAR